jgi:phosphate transport system protein
MRAIFDAELQQLGTDLIRMAQHVQGAVTAASEALLEGDMEKAQSVIADDRLLDELEAAVDEQCVLLIAQQQPVGLDLRTVVASLRISAALERMGDLAQHVAEAARRAYPQSAVPDSQRATVEAMAAAAKRAAEEVVTLLETRDLNVAARIVGDDDELDQLHQQSYDLLLEPSYKGAPKEVLDMALLARYYERFGDHAVSVSRRIVYLVTGDHNNERAAI